MVNDGQVDAGEVHPNGEASAVTSEPEPFDFTARRREALDAYLPVRDRYARLADAVRAVLREALVQEGLKTHSIDARAKDAESFATKASLSAEDDPNCPKYVDPLLEITYLAGVRVITFFLQDLQRVTKVITREFEVIEATDMGAALIEEDRFGYQSLHYLVRFSSIRTGLPEYEQYKGLVCEIQVRTVLQHSWAEIEHDIQYKSAVTTPAEIRRRFMSLAGLLEIADREFEAIHAADEQLRRAAITSVSEGQLSTVEITMGAIKAYLEKRLSPDGRISAWTYEVLARQLRVLGFSTLDQLDSAIRDYNDDDLSYMLWGTRQGQVTRFEAMLLAAMGERYIERHPMRREPWWVHTTRRHLETMRGRNVPIKDYDPGADPPVAA